MIQKLLFLILPFFILVFVATVNAQTGTNSASKLKDQMQLLKDQRQEALKIKKETRVELRQQIKEAVQAKREAVKAAVGAKREEFKAKLGAIKDERKKALVTRIDTKLSNVNTKHTDRFAQVLGNLQTILDKMSENVDKTEAQTAIDAAQAAVETQAAKTYAITISTETALRPDVGIVTSQLRQDLVSVHKLVIDAKQAVQVLRASNAIIKKEATNSANL